MEIIGAGFGRTGTTSLKAALDQLGVGPCFHMSEVFEHPERVAMFHAATRGETVDWDRVFEGYRSTVDWPGATFWRELIARYPDAKVLLSERDPDRWYESVTNTIWRNRAGAEDQDPQMAELLRQMPNIAETRALVQEQIWEGTFGGRFADKEHALRVFREHNAAVRREVPAEKLLVWRAGDGWEPLCEFLGVDVPAEPFPHLNDGQGFRQRVAERLAELSGQPE